MTNHEKTLEIANPAVRKSNVPFIFVLKIDLFEGGEGKRERILSGLTAGHRAAPHPLRGSILGLLRS